MSNYFVDIGWQSQNKHGELLCGDHVEVVHQNEEQAVVVLARDFHMVAAKQFPVFIVALPANINKIIVHLRRGLLVPV